MLSEYPISTLFRPINTTYIVGYALGEGNTQSYGIDHNRLVRYYDNGKILRQTLSIPQIYPLLIA